MFVIDNECGGINKCTRPGDNGSCNYVLLYYVFAVLVQMFSIDTDG